MKKNLLISLLLSGVAAIFVLIGCQKETIKSAQDEVPQTPLNVQEAKGLYGRLLDPTPVASPLSPVYNMSNYTPLWDKATVAENEKEYVVEVPIQFKKTPGILTETPGKKSDPNSIDTKTKLLVLRNKKNGYIHFVLMNIVPEKGSKNDVNYRTKDSQFSGYVIFTNLNGGFINSWKYENGVAVKEGHQTSEPPSTNLLADPPSGGDCWTVGTDFYERTCTETGYQTNEYTCGPWQYLYSNTITYCNNTNGSGGGGGAGPTDWGTPEATNKLCKTNYNFSHMGVTYLTTLNNLSWTFVSPQGQAYTVTYPKSCLIVSDVKTPLEQGAFFNGQVNDAASNVLIGLNNGTISYSNLTNAFRDAVHANVIRFNDCSWTEGACGNGAPETDIVSGSYCPRTPPTGPATEE